MKKKSSKNHKVVKQTERDNIGDILTDNIRFYAGPELLIHNPRRTIATMLLMAAKLYDKRVLKDDSLLRAKLLAKLVRETGELAPALGHVLLAMEINDKQFFIDFGRCLSGDIKDPT